MSGTGRAALSAFAFVLSTCGLFAGVAAATVAFSASTPISASLPVGKGVHPIAITWADHKSGARFHGSVGNTLIEGISVQPKPLVDTFVASGTLGNQAFRVRFSGSLRDNHFAYNATGTVGTEVLHGTATLTLKSNDSGTLSFQGTVGRMTISGSIVLPANTHGTEKGTVSVS